MLLPTLILLRSRYEIERTPPESVLTEAHSTCMKLRRIEAQRRRNPPDLRGSPWNLMIATSSATLQWMSRRVINLRS